MALLLLNSYFSPSELINIVKRNKNINFSVKNKLQENVSSLLIKLNNQVLLLNLIDHSNFDYEYKDNDNGNNIIMLSAISQVNVLEKLLKKDEMKRKINEVNNKNENALIIATKAGCVDSVKLLLKNHINVNQQDVLGNTALHYAINIGDTYLVKLIASKKANYNLVNKEGLTPSLCAIRKGNKEISSVMSNPKKEVNRSKHNVSKVAYDKNKDVFDYIIPKSSENYQKFNLEEVFNNSNKPYYPTNMDKKGLLKEIVIGLGYI
ncbi:hypothetical protein PIROE2DRAFT_60478 [Piromyces sp. E2]|nr:hypothetical protein PIROE2DRAFT_60478 [Piromyces sp. E2]|eukprot:OUM64683.1 hypothetical protein PIROE2DRAFT_60478 [Piromyces sp. E2]